MPIFPVHNQLEVQSCLAQFSRVAKWQLLQYTRLIKTYIAWHNLLRAIPLDGSLQQIMEAFVISRYNWNKWN